MRRILTQEGLDALRWDMCEHPLKLGKKESKLEIFLRNLGLNQLTKRPSDEQILRLYREEKIKTKLRERSSVYERAHSRLKPVVGSVIDILNIVKVRDYVNALERDDEIAESVIAMIPYAR